MGREFFQRQTYRETWSSDPVGATAVLGSGFGFPVATPDDVSVNAPFGDSLVAYKFGDNPTGVMIIGPHRVAGLDRSLVDYPYIVETANEPPMRPIVASATVVLSDDFDSVLEWVRSKGFRHRLDDATPHLRSRRLWIGWGPEKSDPWYQPQHDAGIKLEFVQPAPPGDAKSAEDSAPFRMKTVQASSDVVRFEASMYLAPELRGPVASLSEAFEWEPARSWSAPGADFVEFSFVNSDSATIQFVAPTTTDGTVGRHLGEWGAGPYLQRLVCRDLDAREEQLRKSGVRFSRAEAIDGSGRPALIAEGGTDFFGAFEFVAEDAGPA